MSRAERVLALGPQSLQKQAPGALTAQRSDVAGADLISLRGSAAEHHVPSLSTSAGTGSSPAATRHPPTRPSAPTCARATHVQTAGARRVER
jgi:hypothetical protein